MEFLVTSSPMKKPTALAMPGDTTKTNPRQKKHM